MKIRVMFVVIFGSVALSLANQVPIPEKLFINQKACGQIYTPKFVSDLDKYKPVPPNNNKNNGIWVDFTPNLVTKYVTKSPDMNGADFLDNMGSNERNIVLGKGLSVENDNIEENDMKTMKSEKLVSIHSDHYPFVVTLFTELSPGVEKPLCSAVIINNYYLVVAAHCVFDKTPKSLLFTVKSGEVYRIKSFCVHPYYKPGQIIYDIALLEVNKYITFRTSARDCVSSYQTNAACVLPSRHKYYQNIYKVYKGWGHVVGFDIENEDLAMLEEDRFIHQQRCTPGQKMQPNILCLKGNIQIDQKLARIGSVAFFTMYHASTLFGLATEQPSLYTAVPSYSDWIQKTIYSLNGYTGSSA